MCGHRMQIHIFSLACILKQILFLLNNAKFKNIIDNYFYYFLNILV